MHYMHYSTLINSDQQYHYNDDYVSVIVEGKQQQRYNGDGDDNNGRYL